MPNRQPSARRTFRLTIFAVVLALAAGAGGFIGAWAATFADQASVTDNTFTTVPSFLCGGIACDDFESGGWSGGDGWLVGWSNSGASAITTGGGPYQGMYHMTLRSSTGYAERSLDLSSQSDVHLQFWAKANSWGPSDSAKCLVSSNGTDWNTVRTWTDADDDDTYHFEDIDLSPYTMSSEFYIAFDADMSNPSNYFHVDDLLIKRVPP